MWSMARPFIAPERPSIHFLEVDGVDGKENPHLRDDLDHARKNFRTNPMTFTFPFIPFLAPVGFSISIVHSRVESVPSSTKTLLPQIARALRSLKLRLMRLDTV